MSERWTVDAYLAFEEDSQIKHEYYDGIVYEKLGESRWHNTISGNVLGGLGNQLRKRPCDAFTSLMRVKVSPSQYVYPDVSALCGEPQFITAKTATLLNPTVLVEVISHDNDDYDLRIKTMDFRKIFSLQEYLLISQDRVHIEHYVRQNNNQWLLTDISQLDTTIELMSIQCTLAVTDVYEKVKFDDETP
jgi:Uma2 family endonuclease